MFFGIAVYILIVSQCNLIVNSFLKFFIIKPAGERTINEFQEFPLATSVYHIWTLISIRVIIRVR